DRAVLLKDGLVAFNGPSHEAIVEYRRLLAGEREPDERAAGLKEWGGEIARVERVRLLGSDGSERMQLLSGEPFAIAADVVAERSIAAPRLVWELRDDAAVLAASGEVSTAGLGWGGDSRTLPLRFDVDRPPFSDGRLHLRVDLTDDDGQTQYHSFDDARVFVVYPSDENRGLVRLDGRWSREDSPPAAELERA
ncbi:MAG TPA: Wzt carbohydrate-binding domain-containing protein, partial [Gaiellaceae bacterium]